MALPQTRISANQRFKEPPRWAILERQLIERINQAIEPLLEKYVHQDGSLMWPTRPDFESIDGLDDAYESFHNWPLFYALGGDEKFRQLSFFEWEAITHQFEKYGCGHGHPMVVKEYEQGYDWFHQGEGYLMFYMLGLADPSHAKTIERARRFAGFYLNEDPQAPNYDPKHRLVRCAFVGSKGPAHRNFDIDAWGWAEWKQYYGLPFQGVPGCDHLDDIKVHGNAVNMAQAMKQHMAYGDVAVNLAITSMVTNAYLYTGEVKFRDWVKEYLDAWMGRIVNNGGIIPDNVGLSGKIGETINGKWYGGYYGWTWPHGWVSLGDPVTLAAENALLLFREPAYLEMPRSQMDLLLSQAIERDGDPYVPYKFGDPGSHEYHVSDLILTTGEPSRPGSTYRELLWKDGWFEFQPMNARHPLHVWFLTGDAGDLERIRRIRNQRRRDWDNILDHYEKDQGGHEAAWAAFLNGEYPAYPEDILAHNLTQVERRMAFIEKDTQDPMEYQDWYLQVRNPVTCEGLAQLTLGAPLPLYNGGHLMATVRYFDSHERRPGLPPETAALVERVYPNTIIRLVNLSQEHQRSLYLQAGAYGEHLFKAVRELSVDAQEPPASPSTGKTPVMANTFQVDLPPGTEMRLEIEMERFVHEPRFAFPWH